MDASLKAALEKLELGHLEDKFGELGVTEGKDVLELGKEDLQSIGLTLVHIRKLQNLLKGKQPAVTAPAAKAKVPVAEAAAKKAEEPPAKKAKTEEKPAEPEEKKVVEPPKELETDAAPDKNPKIKEKVAFLVKDTTMNVADSSFGNMLTCFTDGGLQYFLGGARASVGIKSGRYMFEVNVVELMHQKTDQVNLTGRVPQPRNFFRVGLSTEGSTLLIGEDAESVCFDAEGTFIHNKKKVQVGAKFERGMNVCLIVNLDATSPNANTISVFKDGERICQPQVLPESLRGKALYPTLTYRNVTVHYNFGPVHHAALPFTCRTWQDVSVKDAVVAKEEPPKDGKYTALFPTCLPDEGGFQWLDNFLKDNPDYVELSDRAILDWAQRSGIARLKPYSQRICNDKPEMGFGLPTIDDKSIQKMMAATAWMQKRNFVVLEVHANLLKDERVELLKSFTDFKKVALVVAGEPPKAFKQLTHEAMLQDKQAAVDAEFKKKLEEDKKKKAVEKVKKAKEKQQKKQEKAAKKAAEERKKKLQESLKKREEDKVKAAEAKKKVAEKAAAEKKKKEAAEKKKAEKEAAAKAKAESGVVDLDDDAVEEIDEEEVKDDEDEEMKEEEVKEEEGKEEAKEETKEESEEESEEEAVEMEEADPEPPIAELTAEEKKIVFKPCATPDVTAATLNGGFAKYSFPEKSEGFDDIKFEWANEKKSAEHLAAWRTEKKITARIEDLVPGEWFDSKQKEWSKFLQACKQKQNDYKSAVSKRASDKAAKEKVRQMKELQKKKKIADEKAKKVAKAAAKEKADLAKAAAKEKADLAKVAAKKAKAVAKEKADKERAEKIENGEEVPEETAEEVEEEEEKEEAEPMEVEEEKAEEEEAEEEEAEEPVSEDEDFDSDAIDIFGVENIFEIGGKPVQPVFAHFGFEDWALMGLRFELNLLVHAFKKDVKDAERAQIHEDNVAFYYQKYYKKGLSPTFFGVKTSKDLINFFADTLAITPQRVLETHLPCDFEALNVFVLLGEAARRDRARRIDLGEEAAKIKMTSVTSSSTSISGKAYGVSSAQMGAIATLQAQTGHRPPQTWGPSPLQRPGLVQVGQVPRPPAYYGAPAQPLWRPQGAVISPMGSAGAWGPRPAGAWGGYGMARPYGGMVRPAGPYGGMVRPSGW